MEEVSAELGHVELYFVGIELGQLVQLSKDFIDFLSSVERHYQVEDVFSLGGVHHCLRAAILTWLVLVVDKAFQLLPSAFPFLKRWDQNHTSAIFHCSIALTYLSVKLTTTFLNALCTCSLRTFC